ncbi:MAG: ribonuclease III [Candidatus Gracilibacteria bacterium]|nr:ribonuclease III [Candidatus Gracilibacteria bacterium]
MSYDDLFKIIGFTESEVEKDLFERVFIHRSYVNEHRKEKLESNERLEFLGDAVLELVTTEYLYKNFDNPEGDLTNWRSALVKGTTLATIALELNLGQYLKLSRGEEKSGGREKEYLLANTVEALIGFIYLQGGYAKSQLFIHRFILVKLQEILEKKLHIDSKSFFQETSQEKLGITPTYDVIDHHGPDHQKTFTMGVYLEKDLIGQGKGASKQAAEQSAARDALINKGWIKEGPLE